jgi:DNA-binding NarL/FixJ family response regulator
VNWPSARARAGAAAGCGRCCRSGRCDAPARSARHRAAAPSAPSARAVVDRLTAREREVLALVGQGRANKDIARAMFISERTARTHVSNILRKRELSSRTQAAIVANRAGLGDR